MFSITKRRLVSLISASTMIATLAVALAPTAAMAATPPAPYFNGFETASGAVSPVTADNEAMFDVARVASGTSGINAASGGWYAQAAQNPYTTGTLSPFTRLGGYSGTFPTGGYTTSVDIYLDMAQNAAVGTDLRFDWSSAINNPTDTHRRDFIFNVGTDPTTAQQFVVSASNNAPGNPAGGLAPLTIMQSGWYTFQHRFYDQGAGVLAVDMRVLDAQGNLLSAWTRSDPSDIIGQTVGGNRYAWLVDNDLPLALDNLTRESKCTPTGFVRDGIDLTAAQIGGSVTGSLDATSCDIGVYNPTSVTNADISGARYYGVVANGVTVNTTDNYIHNIGDQPVSITNPMHGMQRGIGIFYTNASGTIEGNFVSVYQKGGIVARDGGKVTITDNQVTGFGPVDFIAQNGIQVSFGTSARLFGNVVTGNDYTGAKVTACGLLIYKAGGVSGDSKAGISFIKADNDIHGNETDVCNFGKGGAFSL